MTRQDFMDFFRADDFHNNVTVDDCIEIFTSVLVGSTDVTAERLNDIINKYSVYNLEVIETKDKKVAEISYWLFGNEATNSFNDTGDVDAILDENIEYCIHEYNPLTDPTADLLLSTKDGWDGAALLTTEQYEKLLNDEESFDKTVCRNGKPINECNCC